MTRSRIKISSSIWVKMLSRFSIIQAPCNSRSLSRCLPRSKRNSGTWKPYCLRRKIPWLLIKIRLPQLGTIRTQLVKLNSTIRCLTAKQVLRVASLRMPPRKMGKSPKLTFRADKILVPYLRLAPVTTFSLLELPSLIMTILAWTKTDNMTPLVHILRRWMGNRLLRCSSTNRDTKVG